MHNSIHQELSHHEGQEAGGPLTAVETEKKKLFWVKRLPARATADGRYQENKLQLNLPANEDGVLECCGRVRATTRYCYQMDNGTLRRWWLRPMLEGCTGELGVRWRKYESTTGVWPHGSKSPVKCE